MAGERTREQIIELVKQMSEHTVENGCTPGEAAKFAAKVAEYVERFQIQEAELRNARGVVEDIEVCENVLRTGKRVFNPGVTQVVSGLAQGMCCKVIMRHKWYSDVKEMEAVYGVIGEVLDATYVCQIALTVVPALQVMARMEGIEHGYEKAGLVRWANQYLTGAGGEIKRRLDADRAARSKVQAAAHKVSTGLVLVTGDSLAVEHRDAAEELFKRLYPEVKTVFSRSQFDPVANERGRAAGGRVSLNVSVNGSSRQTVALE